MALSKAQPPGPRRGPPSVGLVHGGRSGRNRTGPTRRDHLPRIVLRRMRPVSRPAACRLRRRARRRWSAGTSPLQRWTPAMPVPCLGRRLLQLSHPCRRNRNVVLQTGAPEGIQLKAGTPAPLLAPPGRMAGTGGRRRAPRRQPGGRRGRTTGGQKAQTTRAPMMGSRRPCVGPATYRSRSWKARL